MFQENQKARAKGYTICTWKQFLLKILSRNLNQRVYKTEMMMLELQSCLIYIHFLKKIWNLWSTSPGNMVLTSSVKYFNLFVPPSMDMNLLRVGMKCFRICLKPYAYSAFPQQSTVSIYQFKCYYPIL